MQPVEISSFKPADRDGVIDLILNIQRDEFGIAITVDDQPDLLAIPAFYQSGAGGFWVARVNGVIAGTVGLKDIGDGQGALRKMFVARHARGKGFGVARALLDRLMGEAGCKEIKKIFLGTTDKFIAAHRFYEKSGFVEVWKTALPERFPVMSVDTKFYCIELN